MSSNSEGCCGLSHNDGPGVCNDSASVRSPAARVLSLISAAEHREWFRQIWTIPGASTRQHPAPYPRELATRLVRMFSFVGDTVLDPFLGTGTTSVAAVRATTLQARPPPSVHARAKRPPRPARIQSSVPCPSAMTARQADNTTDAARVV